MSKDQKKSPAATPTGEREINADIEPLSDAELEEVAGGTDPTSPLCGPPDIG